MVDSKEYFIKKYPDYDLFLLCLICDRNVYFKEDCYQISVLETDAGDFVDFQTEYLFCTLDFFYFRHYDLDYVLTDIESDIIKKGNEILLKYLEDRKYNADKISNYNNSINDEHNLYILEKCNKLRSYTFTKIFKNPIEGKYDYNYLIHGKDIYRAIFQSYQNNSLLCTHDIFFFK